MRRRRVCPSAPRSEFAGFRFPPEVIVLAVRWYLRFALSYRDVEELLAEASTSTFSPVLGVTGWLPGGSSPGRWRTDVGRSRSPRTRPGLPTAP
ncbi:hypothetical protein [Parafrankia soli]|uniref:hypothetical protein n=1 Tax=Parafrankia soli TaxID=2599596 RepID=UPI003B5862EA